MVKGRSTTSRRNSVQLSALSFFASTVAVIIAIVGLILYSTLETSNNNTSVVVVADVNLTQTYSLYVDAVTGSDTTLDGTNSSTPFETLQAAVARLNDGGYLANLCEIVVLGYVELGDNPFISFFPASTYCKRIKIRGIRSSRIVDTIDSRVSVVGRNFYTLTGTNGGYGFETYACRFLQDLNSSFVYAVSNNTDTTIDVVAGPDSRLLVGNTIELFNVTSEIRWTTGGFILSSNEAVDVEDIILVPTDATCWHESVTDSRSFYSGTVINTFPNPYYFVQAVPFLPIVDDGAFHGKNIFLQGVFIKGTGRMSLCIDTNSTYIMAPEFLITVQCYRTMRWTYMDTSNNFFYLSPQSKMIFHGLYLSGRLNAYTETDADFTYADIGFAEGQDQATAIKLKFTSSKIRNAMSIFTSGAYIHFHSCEVDSISIGEGSELTIGKRFLGSTTTFTGSGTAINLVSGARAYIRTNVAGNTTTNAPFINVGKGAELHVTIGAGGWNAGGGPGQPLILVGTSGKAYGAGLSVENQNSPGDVIKCGPNPISDWSVTEYNLTTLSFCG